MSIIHENLYDSERLSDIDLKGFISKLMENLKLSYGLGNKISFNIDIDKLVQKIKTILWIPLNLN